MLKQNLFYLITTDAWFMGADGNYYRAVWGRVSIFTAEQALGIEPNKNSTNWYITVGTEEEHAVIAGCQLHYALTCPSPPAPEIEIIDKEYHDGKEYEKVSKSRIYIPVETYPDNEGN